MTVQNLKVRVPIRFPASVSGTAGVKVTKAAGAYTIGLGIDQLLAITGANVTDPSQKRTAVYDPSSGEYSALTLSDLATALFVATSTTSLAIGTGSATFTVQNSKDIQVGDFVLATSDAAPANYMYGQVTAYSGTDLTVNVTVTGGSGTKADWTIRSTGPIGPGSGDMLGANNLSDVADAATSRTNLGLGTAATYAASSFAIAVDTVSAATALSPDTTILEIVTRGYTTAGDDGAARWVYNAGTPSHSVYFTTANSRKYELKSTEPRPEMCGAIGDRTTTDTTAVQNWIDYCGIVGVKGKARNAYKCGLLTVTNADTQIELENTAELYFPTVGSSHGAITVSADNFSLTGEGKITGPSSAVYVGAEYGIKEIGTSTSSRLSGLTVSGIEISLFGEGGIYCQFVNNIRVEKCKIHDCGYSGAMFLTCDHGDFVYNDVHDITPGTSSNMYGVSLTHDSTGYSSDSNKNTKQATNAFCSGWTIAFNEIYNLNWEGVDTHGAYDSRVIGNRIYNTKHGISVTESSGDADNYAGWQNVVIGNLVDARNKDGSSSGRENTSYGININGGSSTSANPRTVVSGNILRYKGVASNNSTGAIQATNAASFVIANNVIDLWNGIAILVTLGEGIVSCNEIGGTNAGTDTYKYCIDDEGPTTGRLTLIGNSHHPGSGGAAAMGFHQAASATVRPMLSGNNFSAATAPFSLSAVGFCLGSDVTPILIPSGVNTTNTIALSELEGNDALVSLTSTATYNVTTFTGYASGQKITIINDSSGAPTITRSMAKLASSSSQTLAANGGNIQLQFYGSVAYQISSNMSVG